MKTWDVVVIGGGPAGQKAAIQAAKAGRSALLVERDGAVGGSCVHHGTIPSKTLRETALAFSGLHRKSGAVLEASIPEDVQVLSLMKRLDQVVRAHERFIANQLARNGVERRHGRARFLSAEEIEITSVLGATERVRAKFFVIATGSRPRAPREVPIDHEHVLDSDSILSLTYLPTSMVVIGAGVIASEYASIFAALGVRVTMVDKGSRPLAFLDGEIVSRFVETFTKSGGRFVGGVSVRAVRHDKSGEMEVTLDSGEALRADKVLSAQGRVANVEGLDLAAAGLAVNERGVIVVDDHGMTAVPHIFAVGDVIGPPSLASASMDQGRRAVCRALDLGPISPPELTPTGVYTIPEMASVGLDEEAARAKYGDVRVGRARFEELARGHIAAVEEGMLKLVADAKGERIVGVQIVGEGAAELVHVGQMAMITKQRVELFVDTIFNFPTMAEAYRVAAFDILSKR